jgi:hypothetical protein
MTTNTVLVENHVSVRQAIAFLMDWEPAFKLDFIHSRRIAKRLG